MANKVKVTLKKSLIGSSERQEYSKTQITPKR